MEVVDVEDLLRRAMQLPPEARAALAGSLLESLDEVVDADAEAAWAAENERRVQQVDSGSVKLEPWAEVRNKMRR